MSPGTDATQTARTDETHSQGPGVANPNPVSMHLTTGFREVVSSPVGGRNSTDAYFEFADAMLPRWRRVLAAAPSALERKRPSSQARGLFHTTAAALASALWNETRRDGPFERWLSGSIESALVGWQLSHSGDGRPRSRHLRRDALTVASTYHVVLLLSESSRFQTALLLSDLAAHLQWLSSRTGFPPWIEARIVASLAGGGVLLRDGKLVEIAKTRAAALCGCEGITDWMQPKNGGDLSLLSATLDPLARVHSLHQWGFLRPALAAMVDVLGMAVDRTGALGGLRNVLRLPFPLPFGVETLVRCGIPCRRLAVLCREAAARIDTRALLSWGEDLVAMVGPSATMSPIGGDVHPLQDPDVIDASGICADDLNAGISVYKTLAYDAFVDHRRGGSIRIRWARSGHSQEDHGLRAVFGGTSLTSESWADARLMEGNAGDMTISGEFAVDGRQMPSGLAAASRPGMSRPRIARRWFGLRTSGDRYTRRIVFEPTRVTMTDSFRLRRVAELVLVGANELEDHPGPLGENRFHDSSIDALVLEGVSGATITRVFEHGRLVRRNVSE